MGLEKYHIKWCCKELVFNIVMMFADVQNMLHLWNV